MIYQKEELIKIIRGELNQDKPPFLAFSKSKYYVPDYNEILKINSFYKNSFITHFDVRTSQNWNCRSYAESYKVMANLYHAKFIKSEGFSIAIGNAYMTNNRNGHVLNLIYFKNENNIVNYGFLDTLGNFEYLDKEKRYSIKLVVF